MVGVDKGVIVKLFLSLLAIAIAVTYLMSDTANEGRGRMRGSAVDDQHFRRSLLAMRRWKQWQRQKRRGEFVPIMDPKSVMLRVDNAIETARAQMSADASDVESVDAETSISQGSSGVAVRMRRWKQWQRRKRRGTFLPIMDPRSVTPRIDNGIETDRAQTFADSETSISQGSSGVAVRIEGPALETPFPFHATDSDHCVDRREIESLSAAVRQALEGGVRVFPRNGFLLGIVRHGGFLPNEHVDADLGIVASDLAGLRKKGQWPRVTYRKAGFTCAVRATETYWRNWRGVDPATGDPYEFLGVNLHGIVGDLQTNSLYEYGDSGKFFFPWLTNRKNHAAALATAVRYNEEGANIRILDTDERLDASNYRSEAQMGTVLDTDLTCFVERQFYFTTIPVPCDYDGILTSQYGRNWHHVESRWDVALDDGRETKYESVRVSEEANDALLRGGPRPICMQ